MRGVLDFALICIVLGGLEALLPDNLGIAFQVGLTVFEFVFLVGYFVVGHARYQATLGKKLFKLKITRDGTYGRPSQLRCWIRAIFFPFSLLMGVGLIMALFNPRRQTFHDMLAGTIVVSIS